MTVAYYYTRICYILLHKRTHCHMLYFQNAQNRDFCEGFFLLHWLLMLYKAKLNMYAHRISFSAARSRSTLVKGSLITVPASVFPLLSSTAFFSLSKIHYNGPRHVTKIRATHFIFYLRLKKMYTVLNNMLSLFPQNFWCVFIYRETQYPYDWFIDSYHKSVLNRLLLI